MSVLPKKEQSYTNFYDRKIKFMRRFLKTGEVSEAMLHKYKILLKINILQEEYDNILETDEKFLPCHKELEEFKE